MNEYGIIDYRKPVGPQNDYRTSTYRGHLQLDEQFPTHDAGTLPNVCKKFKQHLGFEEKPRSEHQVQYDFKAPDPNNIRNPTVNNTKFIKPLDDARLRNAPKQLVVRPTNFTDFKWRPKAYEEKAPPLKMMTAVAPNPVINIHRGKPGYAKFLDPSATTNNLTYVAYTPAELGIAANDTITFYNSQKYKFNVFKVKETQCDKFRSAECPKRHLEFQSLTKHVPNGGQTTETKSKYVAQEGLNFDITHIRNKVIYCPEMKVSGDTESKLYGSKNRIQMFIK